MPDRAHVGFVDAHAEGVGGDDHVDVAAHEALLDRGALLGFHAGVVGQRRSGPLRAAAPPPHRCPCGCRSRRSPAGWRGRRARPRAAPGAAPWSRCLRAGRRRRRGWGGRSRSAPAAARASRSERRSPPRPASSPSPCRPSPSAAPACRRSAAAAGSRAGSRAPTRRRSAPRRPRSGRSAAAPARRGRRSSRTAPASSRRSAPRRSRTSPSARRSRLVAHPRGDHRHRVPGRRQPRPLIPHQRDQGADDDRQVLGSEPRQLVAEALAAARRHHDQRVAPFQRGFHRLLLPRPPVLEPELPQQLISPISSRDSHPPRLSHRGGTGLSPAIERYLLDIGGSAPPSSLFAADDRPPEPATASRPACRSTGPACGCRPWSGLRS